MRLSPVKDPESVFWYLIAVVDADLHALACQPEINGGSEQSGLFMHAVLARLREVAHDPSSNVNLDTNEGRVAYEQWFDRFVVRNVLQPSVPGRLTAVARLRRDAGQQDGPDQHLSPASLLIRQDLSDLTWASSVLPSVRARMLPHMLRPISAPRPDRAFEQLQAAGEDCFRVVRLAMAGPPEPCGGDGAAWPADADLSDAACLAWILPFLRLVWDTAGGVLTMQEARTTSIAEWLDGRPSEEARVFAWRLYRRFEAGWNQGCSGGGDVRNGCRLVSVPAMHPTRPLAIACPAVNPPPLTPKCLDFGLEGTPPPEHLAATVLHELAVKHNTVLARAAEYLSSLGCKHVTATLHPGTELLLEQNNECRDGEMKENGRLGRCALPSGAAADTGSQMRLVLKVQDAATCDLLVYPSQIDDALHQVTHLQGGSDASNVADGRQLLDLGMDQLLGLCYQQPYGATCPPQGSFDLATAEGVLVQWLLAGRPPLQVTCVDHSEMAADIKPFPYRLYHGSITAAVLSAVVTRSAVRQVSLSLGAGRQKTAELEAALFRSPVMADKVCEVTGEIIPILLGARESLVERTGTIAEFVQLCVRAGRTISNDATPAATVHPNALERVHSLPQVAALPLSVLVACYLLARDVGAMVRPQVSVGDVLIVLSSTGTGVETPDLAQGLVADPKDHHALDVVARLLARCIYLSPEPPAGSLVPGEDELAEMQTGGVNSTPPEPVVLLSCLAESMDFLDEIEQHKLDARLPELLPPPLRHWGRHSHGHTLPAFRSFQSAWLSVMGPRLQPVRAVRSGAARRGLSQQVDGDGDDSGLIRPALPQRQPWTGRKHPVVASSNSDSSSDDEAASGSGGTVLNRFASLLGRRKRHKF